MQNADRYRAAERHVERKLGFLIHLVVYVLVNAGLVTLNLLLQPQRPWSLGPLFGWGIGLLFHALAVFLHAPGAAWKQRLIERELDKRQHPPS
ncbi:MAG: 2TM domain-containing protein [Burkholderiaceae bacterium]